MRPRRFSPPLRYAAYAAVGLVAFFAAAGLGAAASLVVGWQSERGATGPGEPTLPDVPEGTAIEVTNAADDTGAGGDAFVHRAAKANSRGDYTYLDHPRANGAPEAVVLAEPSPGRGERAGAPYDHNVGVWYEPERRRWAIFNQDLAAVPAGATFEVAVPPADRGFVHRAAQDNTVGNATFLDDPLTNGKPEAEVSVTQNWNPGGGVGVYNDHPVGVLYDEDVEKWSVYNKDGAPMPNGAAFNVAVSG